MTRGALPHATSVPAAITAAVVIPASAVVTIMATVPVAVMPRMPITAARQGEAGEKHRGDHWLGTHEHSPTENASTNRLCWTFPESCRGVTP